MLDSVVLCPMLSEFVWPKLIASTSVVEELVMAETVVPDSVRLGVVRLLAVSLGSMLDRDRRLSQKPTS